MVFENWVKNIQAAAYNGARTVYCFEISGFYLIYTSNEKRKTQYEHLIIICQNLIGLQS